MTKLTDTRMIVEVMALADDITTLAEEWKMLADDTRTSFEDVKTWGHYLKCMVIG